jgi:hypothetical protein
MRVARPGRRSARAIAILLGAALTSAATPAVAQAPAPPTQTAPDATVEARAHFDRGVTFYDETDYAAALVEFQRAYALAPAWQVLFNIGQSQFQLRLYAPALGTLRRFLAEGGDRVPAARRSVADSEIADLANRVGHLDITSNERGAAISVDGEPVGTAPLKEPPLVSVGVRHVKAVYSGTGPARRSIDSVESDVSVAVGETVAVHLDFPSEPQVAAEPSPAPRSSTVAATASAPAPAHGPNHAPAYVAFGVAAAGAVVGGVFGGLTLSDKSRLDDECVGKACRAGAQTDIDSASRDGAVSTIAFAVAGVGLVTGVVLWLAAGPGRGDAARVRGTPRVTFAGPGFVTGTF